MIASYMISSQMISSQMISSLKERHRYPSMKNVKLILILLLALLLSACGANTASSPEQSLLTPEETTERLMESLKNLDLDFFNKHSDNYVSTERNWLGIPTRKEYQVFNQLLQPFHGNGKRYRANYQFSQKLMENLAWEIKTVRQEGSQAEINMEVTNIDMAKAMGYYTISLLENMNDGEGTGFFRLTKDIADLIYSAGSVDNLILAIEKLDKDDVSTINVTLLAYQEDGIWKIHLNEDFINAFMGNIDSENYSHEIERKIEDLTLQYEEKFELPPDTP